MRMKKNRQGRIGIVLGIMLALVVGFGGLALAEHIPLHIEKVVSEGTVIIVDAEGQILIVQKTDGKKVSLEVTQETELFLDGEPRGVELLESMEAGHTVVKAEHYTNDAGMQEVTSLNVLKLK